MTAPILPPHPRRPRRAAVVPLPAAAVTSWQPLARHDLRAWAAFAVIAVLLLALVPFGPSASAQLPPLPDPGLPADQEEDEGEPDAAQEGKGLKTAYYTSPTSEALPNTLISEFPPGVACILFPEACGDDANQIGDPLEELLLEGAGGLDAVAGADSPQPVPPGTLPVSILSGQQRYASALGIPLPGLDDGKVFGELLITLQMTDQAFALESPVFRELVGATLVQFTPNAGPEAFEILLQNIADGTTPAFTTDFPGLEMCVISVPWEAGESQPVADQPEIDPLACSAVAKPGEDGTVTFDMTFPGNSAVDGLLPGWEGVLVRPLGAQNLAYGDRDYTTNYIAYIEDPAVAPPTVTSSQVEGPVTVPVAGGQPAGGTGGTSGSGGSSGSGGTTGSTGSSGGGSTPPAPSTAAITDDLADGGDEIAPPGGADDAEALADDAFGAPPPDDGTPVDVASSGWIPWLLLPMLLGGALWYGLVLDAPPTEVFSRSGAMTRLLRRRGFQL